jgi:hypothetical protein
MHFLHAENLPDLHAIDHLPRRTAVAVKPPHNIRQLYLVFGLRFIDEDFARPKSVVAI